MVSTHGSADLDDISIDNLLLQVVPNACQVREREDG